MGNYYSLLKEIIEDLDAELILLPPVSDDVFLSQSIIVKIKTGEKRIDNFKSQVLIQIRADMKKVMLKTAEVETDMSEPLSIKIIQNVFDLYKQTLLSKI